MQNRFLRLEFFCDQSYLVVYLSLIMMAAPVFDKTQVRPSKTLSLYHKLWFIILPFGKYLWSIRTFLVRHQNAFLRLSPFSKLIHSCHHHHSAKLKWLHFWNLSGWSSKFAKTNSSWIIQQSDEQGLANVRLRTKPTGTSKHTDLIEQTLSWLSQNL